MHSCTAREHGGHRYILWMSLADGKETFNLQAPVWSMLCYSHTKYSHNQLYSLTSQTQPFFLTLNIHMACFRADGNSYTWHMGWHKVAEPSYIYVTYLLGMYTKEFSFLESPRKEKGTALRFTQLALLQLLHTCNMPWNIVIMIPSIIYNSSGNCYGGKQSNTYSSALYCQ